MNDWALVVLILGLWWSLIALFIALAFVSSTRRKWSE